MNANISVDYTAGTADWRSQIENPLFPDSATA